MLLLAAREDPAFGAQLTALLGRPRREREPLIRTALHEMELRGEDAAACAAFGRLVDDATAERALRLLAEEN